MLKACVEDGGRVCQTNWICHSFFSLFCNLFSLFFEAFVSNTQASMVMGNNLPNKLCLINCNTPSLTSGKNHFHEMNGDVGMAGWK